MSIFVYLHNFFLNELIYFETISTIFEKLTANILLSYFFAEMSPSNVKDICGIDGNKNECPFKGQMSHILVVFFSIFNA